MAGDVMATIHKAVPWIEEQTGIDVTPCHDADGTWNPGPACTGFSVDPLSAGRSWANGCAEPRATPPLASCGPAFNGAPPADAGARGADAREYAPRPPDAAVEPVPAPDAGMPVTWMPPPGVPLEVPRADAGPGRMIPDAGALGIDLHTGLGCSCRLGGGRPAPAPLFVLALLALALLRQRRRAKGYTRRRDPQMRKCIWGNTRTL